MMLRYRQLLLLCCCCCTLGALINVVGAALIPEGSQQHYELVSKVSLRQMPGEHAVQGDPYYTLRTKLKFNSVWHSGDAQLLEVFFSDSEISAPALETIYEEATRAITKIPDRPFYISMVAGRPQKVIAHTSRDQSLLNLERAIASHLQLQFVDGPVREVDVSGLCNTFYHVKSSTHVEKTKTDCSHWDLRVHYRNDAAFSVKQRSEMHVDYKLTADGILQHVKSHETQRISLLAKPDAGTVVDSVFELKHVRIGVELVEQLKYETVEGAIGSLLEWYRIFDIEADVDGVISEHPIKLKRALKSNLKYLSPTLIGVPQLASSFVELLPLLRTATEEELVEILKVNKEVHATLVDLYGAVQTIDAHKAINEVFKYNNANDAELLEKYLQALAVGTHPERAIIKHLFSLLNDSTENAIKDGKLQDTITQTVAALTHHSGFDANDVLLQKVRAYLLQGLQLKCVEYKAEEVTACKTLYIRALQNLRDPSTIDALLQEASAVSGKISVAAMQALKTFPLVHFNETHRQYFEQIFFQKKRKYDSSARTLALEIILAMKPNPEQLGNLLDYLASTDRQFETKTYVVQKLNSLAAQCSRFRALLTAQLAARPHINNYHILAQKGLTTVLKRQLLSAPAFNESLLSIQEVQQGILKRGTVELLMSAGERDETSTFKLGIYTNGLSSFVGDDDGTNGGSSNIPPDDESELDEDSTATAGMEIAVQGIMLRPLVFFIGQTELMGHVWGGTASEPTPAYQATTLVQDHEQYVILSSGATIFNRVLGVRSVNLNGKVNFSLWNRNAETEIKQNIASYVTGYTNVGLNYANLKGEFIVKQEPNIVLNADLDFYSGIKLCMKLQRTKVLLRHTNIQAVSLNVFPLYSKRMYSTLVHKSPGRTLALNQKNNEMCNMIFSDN